jgi:hypothetical protein
MSSEEASSGNISMTGSPVMRLMQKMSIEMASNASNDWHRRLRI